MNISRRSAIVLAVAVVIALGMAWGLGFRGGVGHAAGSRDCGKCHDDARVGWQSSPPEV